MDRITSSDWPQNLWEDIIRSASWWVTRMDEPEQPFVLFAPNLDSVLEVALDERQQKVIRMRYEQGLTYQEIGKAFDVGVERARQIKVASLHKLSEPKYYLQIWAVPKIEVRRLQSEVKELTRQKEELEKQIEILAKHISKAETEKAVAQKEKPLSTPIAELALPMRCLTCLTAHGIKTIGELLGYTKSELQEIRNLGKKSVADIERVLNACGYELEQ